MRLSILIFCLFHGTCWTSDHYCVYQPRTIHVKEGDSVNIPCTYIYPEEIKGKSQIIIQWVKGYGPFCGRTKEYITDNSGNIVDEYKERICRVTHPDNRTESLIIRRLKYTDGNMFCCKANIYRDGDEPLTLSDRYGTSLIFEGVRLVSQVEELMVVPGEEMVIPCNYSQETLGEAKQVTWYRGCDKLCDYNKKEIYSWNTTHPGDVYPYSLVNPPEDVSLRIHSVQGDKYPQYCCHVTTSNETIRSRSSTELIITDLDFTLSPTPTCYTTSTITSAVRIAGYSSPSTQQTERAMDTKSAYLEDTQDVNIRTHPCYTAYPTRADSVTRPWRKGLLAGSPQEYP
ncbi:uncharacterized protein LOC130367313 [Hyla sarda]|uniref:uncharacterized protein LOC130367313 n=1 Tax=Hyla sarda TaxID=327740 RepID=UPI0024C3BB4D|nr:uncharacterized protein LOC130367313 [Hyla sarda]